MPAVGILETVIIRLQQFIGLPLFGVFQPTVQLNRSLLALNNCCKAFSLAERLLKYGVSVDALSYSGYYFDAVKMTG